MTREHVPGDAPTATLYRGARSELVHRLLVLAIALVLGLGIYQLISGSSFKAAPDRPGWTMYESRRDGWSVQFPDSWHARRISHKYRGSLSSAEVHSIVISNLDRAFTRAPCGAGCVSRWVNATGLPAHGIVVQFGSDRSGGIGADCGVPSTPRPLSLAHAQRTMKRLGAGNTPQLELMMNFNEGRSPLMMAWVGSKASLADLGTLEKIVASISYKAVDPPSLGASC